MAVCPKGSLLAYGRGLWEAKTGKKLRNVAIPAGLVYDILFSPDGKTVVYQISESLAQDFSLLFVVRLRYGKKLFQIGDIDPRRGRFFFEPRFSPDGKQLAFAEADRPALHLWVVGAGKVVSAASHWRCRSVWSDSRRTPRPWSRGTTGQRSSSPLGNGNWKGTGDGQVGGGVEAVVLSPDGKTAALVKGTAVEFRRLKD